VNQQVVKQLLLTFMAAACVIATASHAADTKKVIVFIEPDIHYDSVWMADQKGFYRDEGLEVELKNFPTGVAALTAFATGQGDIALSGELPAMRHWATQNKNYRLITVLERDSAGFVVTASNSIKKASDLRGQTIATRVGSTGSWFISEYLAKNGLSTSDVKIINLDPAVLPTALCKGEIGAFFIWQPFGSRTLEICPEKAHYLSNADGYIDGFLVAGARPQWLASPEGKDIALRFVRATRKGKSVAEKDFQSVAQYAKDKYGLSEAATKAEWQTNHRVLGFDNVFYKDHCELAEWMRHEGQLKGPLDYKEYVWTDGIRNVDAHLLSDMPGTC
jgi:NitT/TauT family transport system substrate-binding protein